MRNMKKKTGMILALLLALSLMPGLAGAESAEKGETALARIFEEGRVLLLETDNVTLEGTATFLLDGEEFKTARGTYIQSGTDAYQRIQLSGIDNEGKQRETEYAVLDQNGTVCGSEIYHGKEHVVVRYAVPSRFIMTETRALHQLLNLTRAACQEAGEALGDRMLCEATEDGGQKTTLKIRGEELPPVADSTLNLVFQFLWNRYYRIGYDRLQLPNQYSAVIGDYGTPSEGIVLATRSIALTSAEAEIRQDAEGRITAAEGEAEILLNTAAEGQRTLKAVFSLTAGAYGTSRVTDNEEVQARMAYALEHAKEMPEWIPNLYDQEEGAETSGEWEPSFDESEIPPVPEFQESVTPRDIGSAEEAVAYAREIWWMPCFGIENPDVFEWTVTESEHGYYQVWGRDPKDVPAHFLQMEIGPDGRIYSLKNAVSDLDQAMVTFESPLSDEAQGEYNYRLDRMVRAFAEQLNPGYTRRMGIRTEDENVNGNCYFGTGDMLYSGANRFILFYSDPGLEGQKRETRTKVAVQTDPVTRIVLYNELNDPVEGGNG